MNRVEESGSAYGLFDWFRLFLALEVAFVIHGAGMWLGKSPRVPINAVPAFLALSGFLVLHSLTHSESLKAFWIKRGFRLLPGFALSFVLVFFLFGWNGVRSAWACYMSFRSSSGWFRANGPLWSLSVEEVIYFVLVLLFVAGAYKKMWAVCGLLVVSIAAHLWFGHTAGEWATMTILPSSFFAGNLGYVLRHKLARFGLVWLGCLVLTCVLAYFPLPGVDPFVVSGLRAPVQGFLMVALCISFPAVPRLPFDISYGLYIFHSPIFQYLRYWAKVDLGTYIVLGYVGCVALSLLSWFLVERPCLSLRQRFLKRPTQPLMSNP